MIAGRRNGECIPQKQPRKHAPKRRGYYPAWPGAWGGAGLRVVLWELLRHAGPRHEAADDRVRTPSGPAAGYAVQTLPTKTAIGRAFGRLDLTAAMIHPPLQPDHAMTESEVGSQKSEVDEKTATG